MKLILKRVDAEKSQLELPVGVTTVGRGRLFECPDSKVSRHHALVDFLEDGGVKLKSTHQNATYVWKRNLTKPQFLTKDSEVLLEDGDSFSLLPDCYKFVVVVEGKNQPMEEEVGKSKDEGEAEAKAEELDPVVVIEPLEEEELNGEEKIEVMDEAANDGPLEIDPPLLHEEENQSEVSKLPKHEDVTEKKEDLNASASCREDEPGPSTADNKQDRQDGGDADVVRLVRRERHLPSWMENLSEEPVPKKGAPLKKRGGKENAPSPAKKRPRNAISGSDEEERAARDEEKPVPSRKRTQAKEHARKTDEDEGSDVVVSDSDEAEEEPGTPKKRAAKRKQHPDDEDEDNESQPMSTTGRPICEYRDKCYRKNPDHKRDFSHPGDSDYKDERPECEFGTSCYRKNKDHWMDYRHEHNPNPPRAAKRKANAQRRRQLEEEDEDGENEYDMNDPFMADDDEEEEYSPSEDELEEAETELEEEATEEGDEAALGEEEKKDERRMLKEAKRFLDHD